LMDGPSILASEGVPYVLEGFTTVGTSNEEAKLQPLKPFTTHRHELPLENVVVSWP